MNTLRPIPPPGVALFPNFDPTGGSIHLTMSGDWPVRNWSVNDSTTGATLFLTDSATFSMSRRKQVTDGSGTLLCTIRRERSGLNYVYYGLVGGSDNGQRIFDFDARTRFTSSECYLTFGNQSTGQSEEITWKDSTFDDSPVLYNQMQCATVHRKTVSARGQYDIEVAGGIDPFLVVCMIICEDDRRQMRKR